MRLVSSGSTRARTEGCAVGCPACSPPVSAALSFSPRRALYCRALGVGMSRLVLRAQRALHFANTPHDGFAHAGAAPILVPCLSALSSGDLPNPALAMAFRQDWISLRRVSVNCQNTLECCQKGIWSLHAQQRVKLYRASRPCAPLPCKCSRFLSWVICSSPWCLSCSLRKPRSLGHSKWLMIEASAISCGCRAQGGSFVAVTPHACALMVSDQPGKCLIVTARTE